MFNKSLLCCTGLLLCTALLSGCGKKRAPDNEPERTAPLPQSTSASSSDIMKYAPDASSNLMPDLSDALSEQHSTSNAFNGDAAQRTAAVTTPEQHDAWALRLVNSAHPLPEGFEPETANISGYEHRPFDVRAADALEAMLHAAEQAGHKLYLVSGYRSIERQKALFDKKTELFASEGFSLEEAQKQAAQFVARPGTSEHNLGLAADIVSADWYKTNNDLTTDFDQTPQFAWLSQHCAEYGFILRYPKGKEYITGVKYEPWHYRYIGRHAAQQIMQHGITLEEYLQQEGAT